MFVSTLASFATGCSKEKKSNKAEGLGIIHARKLTPQEIDAVRKDPNSHVVDMPAMPASMSQPGAGANSAH